jgi:hypothetical protein
MQEDAQAYLERARGYDTKAEQAQDPILKLTYQELARSYRMLAAYIPKVSQPAGPGER